jgi:hypothetical protein
VNLIHTGELLDWEISHFNVAGWSASGSVSTPPILEFPGNPNVPNDNILLGNGEFRFDDSTSLYNSEFNIGRRFLRNLRGVAGFRWVELHDLMHGGFTLGGPTIPFLSINVHNHLYGGQTGLDVLLWQNARWEASSTIKGGVFNNSATVVYDRGTVVEHKFAETAFVGDLGLNAKLRLTQRCAVRLGYQMLWIQGLALAPAQLNTVVVIPPPASTPAGGSSLFAHGLSAGLEVRF